LSSRPSHRLVGILALDDFEAAARRHLPRPVFGYVAGAAETDWTLADNRRAFAEYGFLPRMLVDVSKRSARTALFDHPYAAPFGIAPLGISALYAYRGDLVFAAAAARANVPMIMSGSSLIRLEDVVAASPSTWFQAYLPGDEKAIVALIERVARAGFRTLVVTVDSQVAGNRENNIRAGFSTPLKPTLRLAWDGVTHPRWLFGTFLRTLVRYGMPHFENNFATRGAPILSPSVLRDYSDRGHLHWAHWRMVRRMWNGRLIIKGILDKADAQRARDEGADAIVVSNHGGRQLDGAESSIVALPEVVDEVGRRIEVHMDGGIRSGQQVLKAIALGAKGTYIGRAFVYGLGAMGEEGVTTALQIIQKELDLSMAFCGYTDINAVDRSLLIKKR